MFFHICPECDHRNPQGSRFCNSCGAPLQRRFCRSCGAANDVQSPACRACGASLPVITTADESLFAAPAPETRAAPSEACAAAPAAKAQPSVIASLYARAEEGFAIDAAARVDDAATQIRLPVEAVAAAPALPAVAERDDVIDYPAPARRRGRRAAIGFLVLVLAAVVAAFYPTRRPAGPEPFSGSIKTETLPAPGAAAAALPAPSPAATPREPAPEAASAAGATAAANAPAAAPPKAEPTARRIAPSPPPVRPVQRPPTPRPCTPALAALALCELDAESAGR
jgi:2-oxoglutarate dehydrogenase E2 component (dihydrolipoamide succinyltransferase)